MNVIVDNDFMKVEEHEQQRVVVVRRKPAIAGRNLPVDQVTGGYEEILKLFRRTHQGWGLVLDLRDVPGRNDDPFEARASELMTQVRQRFARVVALVATAIGELQVRRMRQGNMFTTRDESEAMRLAAGAP